MLKGIVQDLRNSYDAKDRPAHEDAIKRLEAWHSIKPEDGCTRGAACVCTQHSKTVCMYRTKEK